MRAWTTAVEKGTERRGQLKDLENQLLGLDDRI